MAQSARAANLEKVYQARQVTFQKAKMNIRLAMAANRPVFLWGSPGIGKSALGEELAEESGLKFWDVRLTTMNPVDLRGIPIPDTTKGTAITLPPDCLPQEPNHLVLLDEINAAPPTMQVAAYQLVLKRRVGSYILPDNCYVMACGNKPTDKAITYAMPTPLVSRFSHLELTINAEQWLDWAQRSKIDFRVSSFIRFAKQMLFNFDPQLHTEAFACPRTWEYVSDYAKAAGNEIEKYRALVCGTVGLDAAQQFLSFCDFSDLLPDAAEVILKGNMAVEFPAPHDLSRRYAFTLALVNTIKTADPEDKVGGFINLLKYVQVPNGPENEFAVLAVKDAMRSDEFVMENVLMQADQIPDLDKLYEMVGDFLLPGLKDAVAGLDG